VIFRAFEHLLRHPRWALVGAAIVAIAGGIGSVSLPHRLSERIGDFYSHSSESFVASTELETILPKHSLGLPNIAVIARGGSGATGLQALFQLERQPAVAHAEQAILASRNERSVAVVGWLRKGIPEEAAATQVARALARPGVLVGAPVLVGRELTEQARHDLDRAEIIALPLLLLFGLWVFRSAISALLPVLVGVIALLWTLGCMRVVNVFFPLSIFSLDIAVGFALGLAVDYSLLMVSRFREELSAGRTPREGARVTILTSGKAVALSSATIATTFSSLLIFPIPFIRSIAVAGILVAIGAGCGSLVLLPALFTLLGERVATFGPKRTWKLPIAGASRHNRQCIWYRLAQFVMRRPLAVALVSATLLAIFGFPALMMRFTGYDATVLPASASARVFTERARKEFAHPLVGEIEVAIHGDEATAKTVIQRVNGLAQRTGLATPLRVELERSPHLWQLNLNPSEPVFSRAAERFVRLLRQMRAPLTVTGETASYMDTARTLREGLPYTLAILAVVSLVFLLLGTGSVVLPIKALIVNALSLGASFGMLVVIFQDAHLQGLLGYRSQGALVIDLPIIMGACVFGLLTDYGLFLLMRIKEARESGCSDREAVARGITTTGRVITGAALLFSIAVGAFATAGIVLLKEAAFGIVFAVMLDAVVVRPLLVSSVMIIFGKWNWWPAIRFRSPIVNQ
jgi:uncharacterized membrane protein YdfJ with MMPL/SSD domain